MIIRAGRYYENFRGKLVVNAADGVFEGLSIEELVDSPKQLKEPYKVKLKSIYKVVDKLSDKILDNKIMDYITKLETRNLVYIERILSSEEEIITPRIILEEEEDLLDPEEAIERIEEEYPDNIESVYVPHWYLEYEVLPKGEKKEAWVLASISEPEVYIGTLSLEIRGETSTIVLAKHTHLIPIIHFVNLLLSSLRNLLNFSSDTLTIFSE